MCGIAGIIDFENRSIDKRKLKKMNKLLSHRGPDNEGIYTNKNVGLSHRRLSIIDLSNNANQPMNYKNTSLWIVYNGEIYNYLELKRELQNKGYKFYTNSDTEVILASYIEWGEDSFHKFNGMWAFAIYNSKDNKIVICRDRFGIKPLYYYYDRGKFLFASEKKAIVLSELVELDFDEKGINTAIYSPFILEASGHTEFKNVKTLLPGNLLKVDVSAKYISVKKWYDLLNYIDNDIPEKFNDRADKFRNLFIDSCQLRLRSDVPLATSLSGGLDSSSVVATISKLSGIKYKTFAHSFEGTPLNEFDYANIVAKATNTPLVEVKRVSNYDDIDEILYYFESIYGGMPDSQFRIYKAQKKQGYKISIDGHGADEMLGGYNWYIDEMLKDVSILNFIRIRQLLKHKQKITINKKAKDPYPVLRFFYNKLPDYLRNSIKFILRRQPVKRNDIYNLPVIKFPKSFSSFRKKLYEDFSVTILPRILKNFDLMSMANSIEVRMPFLDYRLVEYTFGLPDEDLITKGWTKFILRNAMQDILDDRVRWRKDKKGFNSPVAEILSNDLKDWTIDAINSKYNIMFNKKTLLNEFELKILNNNRWIDSLIFWKKINAIKLVEIFSKKKRELIT